MNKTNRGNNETEDYDFEAINDPVIRKNPASLGINHQVRFYEIIYLVLFVGIEYWFQLTYFGFWNLTNLYSEPKRQKRNEHGR